MRPVILLAVFFGVSAHAENVSHDITFRSSSGERIVVSSRDFCEPKAEEAKSDCDHWLQTQTKFLGQRMLTAYCPRPKYVRSAASGACTGYHLKGEISFLMNMEPCKR